MGKLLQINQGETFTHIDAKRAHGQLEIVREIMQDGAWLKLSTIAELARALHLKRTGREVQWGEAAISARLRNLRQSLNGAAPMQVDRRRDPAGFYEYRATPIDQTKASQ